MSSFKKMAFVPKGFLGGRHHLVSVLFSLSFCIRASTWRLYKGERGYFRGFAISPKREYALDGPEMMLTFT
jgi:hypothetical protein